MITGSKGAKSSRASTNEILTLGPAKYEEVAKCLYFKHFCGFRIFEGIARVAMQRSNPCYQTGSKGAKSSRASTNEILTLGPAKYEEVAKCLYFKHFCGFRIFEGIARVAMQRSNACYQTGAKGAKSSRACTNGICMFS